MRATLPLVRIMEFPPIRRAKLDTLQVDLGKRHGLGLNKILGAIHAYPTLAMTPGNAK